MRALKPTSVVGWASLCRLASLAGLALSACALAPEPPASPNIPPNGASAAPDELLPRSLYFLSGDDAGLAQVFRIGRDGATKSQLTSEPVDVTDYEVSMADGSIAYVADNRLLLVNVDGRDRRVLADGGPRESSFWITSPVFSPDGRTLAFGHRGVNLYDLMGDTAQLVVEDQYTTVTLPNGLPLPSETYEPERYSPDGTKLLFGVGHPPPTALRPP